MPGERGKDQQMRRAVARIKTRILALSTGLVCGVGLFVTTAWLMVKGGPNIGQHLQLLGQYYPGYSVSWPGAFLGLVYGALTGGLMGWLVGTIYNFIAGIRFR